MEAFAFLWLTGSRLQPPESTAKFGPVSANPYCTLTGKVNIGVVSEFCTSASGSYVMICTL